MASSEPSNVLVARSEVVWCRFATSAFVWLALITAVTQGFLQNATGATAFMAGGVMLAILLRASWRFERQVGGAFRFPIQHSKMILTLLVLPGGSQRERWEKPLLIATIAGIAILVTASLLA